MRELLHPLRLCITLAVVFLGLHVSLTEAQDLAAPRPLPDNPFPAYPDQALGVIADGDVVFLANVTAEGRVESVRVLEVPAEGVGFEDAVREAVLQWRFEPARSNGVPRPAAYAGRIAFTRQLPYTHARMYRQSSEAVWSEAQEVVDTLGRVEEATDVESQILVTQWVRFDAADFGLPPPESAGPGQGLPQEFELHIFVSPFVEPARVHVGSVSIGLNNVQYNLGVAEQWFFRTLERRLGERGQAIPIDAGMHRWVASSLLGAPDSCLDASPTDDATPQAPTRLTAITPMSPEPVSTDAVVILEVVVSLDGAVTSSRAMQVAGSDPDGKVVAAAAGAVSLWRYSPALWERCSVPFTGTANVVFRRPDTDAATPDVQAPGIDVVLLVDTSANSGEQFRTIQQAAAAVLRQLQPGDRAELVEFESKVFRVQPFTSDLSQVEEAVGRLTVGGATAFYNALHIVLTALEETNQGRQGDLRPVAIVVLSDGVDTSSLATFEQVLELAKQSESAIYSVRLGSDSGQQSREAARALRQLAEETGGRSISSGSSMSDLDEAALLIAEGLAGLRLLGP